MLALSGDWRLERGFTSGAAVERELARPPFPRRVAFDAAELGEWDSSLISFVAEVLELCRVRGLAVDPAGLPGGLRRLVELAETVPEKTDAHSVAARAPLAARVGSATIAYAESIGGFVTFLGAVTIALGRFMIGRARYRRVDLLVEIQDCGAKAFGIVTLISFLVGTILAFMGAVQLEQFGASIFVADLVGIGMARDMGAMMTAIIMAGRTGAAFAAQLGTMKVTQEIDALSTMGISPMEFLVLPRVLALILMMPLLCFYSDLMGMLGGAAVGTGMLGLSFTSYFRRDAARGYSVRRAWWRVQEYRLRCNHRDFGMPARLSVRQQFLGGRRRGDLGGGDGNRLHSGRVRSFCAGVQHLEDLRRIGSLKRIAI